MPLQQPIDLRTQNTATQAQPNVTTPGYQSSVNAATSPSAQASSASAVAADLYNQMQPGIVNTQAQQQDLAVQEGLLPLEYQNQQSILQSNYGYQQQQYGVQGEQLGLSQQENLQQQQQLGKEYGYQQQQNTLSGQNIQAAIGNILKNYQTQTGQLNLSQTQANQGMAGSGTLTTGAKKQSDTGFGLERQSLQQNMQYAVFQQEQARKSLGISEAEQKEQFGYSTQQLQNGYKQIGLQLKSLGISEAQANTQFNNAMQQLGLSNTMSLYDFKQQLAAIAGGGYSPMMSMMGQLFQALPGVMQGLFGQNSPAIGGP